MTALPIYLDYAATTPVDPQVARTISDCLVDAEAFGNPASRLHAYGRAAEARVERARGQVAALIGAEAEDIVWTSGATEADNLAVIGAARHRSGVGRHVVTAQTEHPAVLDACRYLERNGFTVTRLAPDSGGIIDPAAVEAALTPATVLVSIMHVNNEIGVIQDIGAIGAVCRARDVLFHVDAAQSAAHLPIDVVAGSIDLLSMSAQKMYGPKGVGALYLNRERIRRVEPLMFGGGQERGLRPGTVPTHQVVGMGEACRLVAERRMADAAQIGALRDRLWAGLGQLPGVLHNGDPGRCVAHILSVSVTGVEGESLHLALRDLAVSAGSACTTLDDAPSAVLRSLGRSDQLARASVRFSLGRPTTVDDIDTAIEAFRAAVDRLRAIVPDAGIALA